MSVIFNHDIEAGMFPQLVVEYWIAIWDREWHEQEALREMRRDWM
jgi:hypothetical protein